MLCYVMLKRGYQKRAYYLLSSQYIGKSEEQLTSYDCRPTVGRQITNSLPTGHRQTTDSRLKKKYYTETYDKITGKTKVSKSKAWLLRFTKMATCLQTRSAFVRPSYAMY